MSAWVHLCFDSTGEMFVTDRAANTHFATISPNISNWAALSLFIWLKCNYKADMRQKNYMDLIFCRSQCGSSSPRTSRGSPAWRGLSSPAGPSSPGLRLPLFFLYDNIFQEHRGRLSHLSLFMIRTFAGGQPGQPVDCDGWQRHQHPGSGSGIRHQALLQAGPGRDQLWGRRSTLKSAAEVFE